MRRKVLKRGKRYAMDVERAIELEGFVTDIEDNRDSLVITFVPDSYTGKISDVARELQVYKDEQKMLQELDGLAKRNEDELYYPDGIFSRIKFIVGDTVVV